MMSEMYVCMYVYCRKSCVRTYREADEELQELPVRLALLQLQDGGAVH